MQELIDKAAVLLEALPYIQRFQGSSFVIKYGGSFMDSPDPDIRNGLARDIVFLRAVGIDTIVLHGGGKAISRAMREEGLEPRFVHGQRVTDAPLAELVDRVLSLQVNPEVVSRIASLGGDAVGLPGRRIFGCRRKRAAAPDGSPLDLGLVGEIVSVDRQAVQQAVGAGRIPVISPTARDAEGRLHNCNADAVAAQLAIALEARRLVFVSDVPGLMEDAGRPETLIPVASTRRVEELKAGSAIGEGMIPKVESALQAIGAGVSKVSMVDGRIPHAVLLEIFTDRGVGTQIVP